MVLMQEELFNLFIEMMEKQNKKKYKVTWGEVVGYDINDPVLEMYVPMVMSVGPDTGEDGIVDGS